MSKTVKWWLDTGFVNGVHEGEFDIHEDATEEEIEYEAKQEAFNQIDWGYEVEEQS